MQAISFDNFLRLKIVNLEGDIARWQNHPKQAYVQSINLLTENHRHTTIEQLIAHWSGVDMAEFLATPGILNEYNWMYVFCIYFRYLRGVGEGSLNIAYKDRTKCDPMLRYAYMSGLEEMGENEITAFLQAQPVLVDEHGMVVDGIHRLAAMIGRVVAAESYITVYAHYTDRRKRIHEHMRRRISVRL